MDATSGRTRPAKDIGLGSVNIVSLDDAREAALRFRRIARSGGDPIAERRKAIGSTLTFKEAALKVHSLTLPTRDNEKHTKQWLSSQENHVFPFIGNIAIGSITSTDINDSASRDFSSRLIALALAFLAL